MTAICCNDCFTEISKVSVRAAHLWLDLCSYYLRLDGMFRVNEALIPLKVPLMKKLEQLGYIDTCDQATDVIVRVNGYDIVESDICLETFCIKRDKHKECL